MTSQSYTVRTSNGPSAFLSGGGYVLPHEHVLLDMRTYWEGEGDWDGLDRLDQGVGFATMDDHRHLPQGTSRENLVLADWYIGALELAEAKSNGCQLVVDLTPSGLSPQPGLVARSFELAKLPVVFSVGRYVDGALSDSDKQNSADGLADLWVTQIARGIEGQSIGIIGEIGTSAKISPAEEISLRAAARSQLATQLPINVHVDPFGRQGHLVLDVLESEGADLNRVALSHCDAEVDVGWLASLAERGAYVEFDLFGTNHDWTILGRGFSSDRERMSSILDLVQLGYAERILMSHDICMKNSLLRYGGWGYGHLGRRILPAIEKKLGPGMRELLSSTNSLRLLSVNPETADA